ncbi:hypothetical protein [Verminephrobacter eiseniae]|uniref:hypothetical protein n=1 Tax=Verminephrobacter eiseniae TaxID=364317 RepID=UPI0022386286|nr:hypothetical protein [Verminephrobacter eiseniae]
MDRNPQAQSQRQGCLGHLEATGVFAHLSFSVSPWGAEVVDRSHRKLGLKATPDIEQTGPARSAKPFGGTDHDVAV